MTETRRNRFFDPRSFRLLALMGVAVAFWAAPALAAGLADRLHREVRRAQPRAGKIAVHVQDLSTGESVYAYRADESRIIASNTKLFTTAAALDALGPGYFFETELLLRGEARGGVLEGDLGVVGGGDPAISGRDFLGDSYGVFRRWAAKLRELGVDRVEGDLFLDHGFFEAVRRHPDWDPRNSYKWYQPPVAALGFNENTVRLEVVAGEGPGEGPSIRWVPELSFFKIEGLPAAGAGGAELLGITTGREGDQIRRWAELAPEARPETYIAVADPVLYFGSVLRAGLAQEGIAIHGRLLPVERLPGLTWRPVAIHRTPLLRVIEVINLESQNFYAESLLKTLGAERCGSGGWAGGLRVVRDFLAGAGLGDEAYEMADGSGLSRRNRFSPRQITRLLAYMDTHPWREPFVDSLARPAQPGTSLEQRLQAGRYRERVEAKTGTLRAVSSLSGYARGLSGQRYAFSIVCNDGSVSRCRQAQDEMVRALVDHG